MSASNGARFETAIWTAKLMLLSIGTVSTFLLFKIALIPCIFHSILPTCVVCLRACLSPPYIYIIVNFIIISIAASSSSSSAADDSKTGPNDEDVTLLAKSEFPGANVPTGAHAEVCCYDEILCDSTVSTKIEGLDVEEVVKHELTSSDPFPYLENNPPPPYEEEDDNYDDSLDGTWKAIMEGKGTVRKPFLKKSDTWNTTRAPPTFPLAERVSNNQKPEMRKSETFNDRETTLRARGGLRGETVLTSQDSLNARVEAFINKFNNDMRMERQQSDMRYINMVKQAAAAT